MSITYTLSFQQASPISLSSSPSLSIDQDGNVTYPVDGVPTVVEAIEVLYSGQSNDSADISVTGDGRVRVVHMSTEAATELPEQGGCSWRSDSQGYVFTLTPPEIAASGTTQTWTLQGMTPLPALRLLEVRVKRQAVNP